MTADLPDTLADTLVQTVFDVLDDHTGTPTGLRDALAAALAPVVAQHADNARADERERPIRERLAEEVREGLEAKGWNQADLAFATNTSEKHISQVLNGNADASVQWWQDTLDALAARTGGTDV